MTISYILGVVWRDPARTNVFRLWPVIASF